jgi:rhodanese-related sulfurtransferase
MSNPAPSVTRRSIVLLPVAAAAWFVLSRDRTSDFKVPEVDLAKGREMFDAGSLILDVRKPDRYEYRHIVGALLMPLATLQSAIPAALAYAKTLPILVYCGDGLTIGPEATHILNQAGFAGAVNLTAGIEGWAAAGYPVKKAAA